MKKILLAILLLSAACGVSKAQNVIEVKGVTSDSLVNYLRTNMGARVYFLKNADDKAFYSVSAPKNFFVSKAVEELKAKGYAASDYDGAWFIATNSVLGNAGLPAGYFDKSLPKSGKGQDLADAENVTATFQNKIYEIGTKTPGRTGKAYVRGYVRDVATGEPLVGVSVYNDKTGAYTVTDVTGFYRIGLPIGECQLGFSGYSLEDVKLNLDVMSDGGLDVDMKEQVTSLKGAVVSAESRSAHRDARMGVEKVRIATIKKVPTAFGEADVLKVVLTLPGVKSVGEAATGFNVRGGATDQNLILFNDATIYNPGHMFGVLSSFNADVINDVELYKSSIPAEYGGRISSVLDIRGKEGNANKVTGSLGIGVLTSSFSLEGPIKKGKTTFVVGGRTTYSDWMLNLLPKDQSEYAGGNAGFSDVNVGITHKFNSNNSIQAFGYWSRDKFSFGSDTTFRYSNMNASIKWNSHFSDRHSMALTAGYDRYESSLEESGYVPQAYQLFTGVQQGYAKLGFKSNFGTHVVSYGLQGIYYDLNPGNRVPIKDGSMVVADALDKQNGIEAAIYLSDTWSPTEKMQIEYGLRGAGFMALNPSKFFIYPEVRLSGKYSFSPDFSVKAGFNTMSQNIHLISNNTSISPMDTWRLSNAKLRPQTGWQAATGAYWTVGDGKVDLSVEGYWKMMHHYPDYISGAILIMNHDLEDDLVETTGKSYGVEFMARKNLGKLNGWISYTWSRALLRETADRGIETINGGNWYNAPHDKPHDFKMVANYKLTHRYSISVNVDYATGRPVTVPVGMYHYANSMMIAYSDRNTHRIPDYFRMDVAMIIEPGHYLKKLAHMSVTFGAYNVTGRKNPYSVFYKTGRAGVQGYMLSVFACPIPYLSLNLKF